MSGKGRCHPTRRAGHRHEAPLASLRIWGTLRGMNTKNRNAFLRVVIGLTFFVPFGVMALAQHGMHSISGIGAALAYAILVAWSSDVSKPGGFLRGMQAAALWSMVLGPVLGKEIDNIVPNVIALVFSWEGVRLAGFLALIAAMIGAAYWYSARREAKELAHSTADD